MWSQNKTSWIISVHIHPSVWCFAHTDHSSTMHAKKSCVCLLLREQSDDPPPFALKSSTHETSPWIWRQFSDVLELSDTVVFSGRNVFELFKLNSLYGFYLAFIFVYFFSPSINTLFHCVTPSLFDNYCFQQPQKHFAATLHNDKSYSAACSSWMQYEDTSFCIIIFFFFFLQMCFYTVGGIIFVVVLNPSKPLFVLELSTSNFELILISNAVWV